MKTFASLSFVVASAAFVASARFEFAVTAFLGAGLGALLMQDYRRGSRPLPVAASRRPRRTLEARFRPPALCVETHRLAA